MEEVFAIALAVVVCLAFWLAASAVLAITVSNTTCQCPGCRTGRWILRKLGVGRGPV